MVSAHPKSTWTLSETASTPDHGTALLHPLRIMTLDIDVVVGTKSAVSRGGFMFIVHYRFSQRRSNLSFIF